MTDVNNMMATFQKFAMQEDLKKLKEVVDTKADGDSFGSSE